jgi:hypothetical protein
LDLGDALAPGDVQPIGHGEGLEGVAVDGVLEDDVLVIAIQDSEQWAEVDVPDFGLGVVVPVEREFGAPEELSDEVAASVLVEHHEGVADPSQGHCVLKALYFPRCLFDAFNFQESLL